MTPEEEEEANKQEEEVVQLQEDDDGHLRRQQQEHQEIPKFLLLQPVSYVSYHQGAPPYYRVVPRRRHSWMCGGG